MNDNILNDNVIPIRFGDCISRTKPINPISKISKDQKPKITEFLINTEILSSTHETLVDATNTEKLCFLSGTRYHKILIPTKILEPVHSIRTSVSVKADPVSVYDMYQYTQRWGLKLCLMCHLHPGTGPNSVYPSSIDLYNLKTWENNFQLIGLIMNRPGYFRFFSSLNRNFIIKLRGWGVKKVGYNIYKFNY